MMDFIVVKDGFYSSERWPLDRYKGFTDRDFYGKDSVYNRIEKRLKSFEGVFKAECKSVRLDYSSSFSGKTWYEDDEIRSIENDILIYGKLFIKFKLN